MEVYIIFLDRDGDRGIVDIYSSLEEAEKHLSFCELIKKGKRWVDPSGLTDLEWHIERWNVVEQFKKNKTRTCGVRV